MMNNDGQYELALNKIRANMPLSEVIFALMWVKSDELSAERQSIHQTLLTEAIRMVDGDTSVAVVKLAMTLYDTTRLPQSAHCYLAKFTENEVTWFDCHDVVVELRRALVNSRREHFQSGQDQIDFLREYANLLEMIDPLLKNEPAWKMHNSLSKLIDMAWGENGFVKTP